jgi:uncharacterized protein
MQELEGRLVLSASDLTRFTACRHLTLLDREVAAGRRPPPQHADEALELLFRRGDEHERAHLERLRREGREVVAISPDGTDAGALRRAEEATVEALARGVDVVHQATFFDGRWRGHADFLFRRDDRPGRWGWSYDIADTKLAQRLKVPALLQMATYGERLAVLQGIEPACLTVIAGDGEQHAYRYADCAAYARLVREQLVAAVADAHPLGTPEPVEHCPQCRWQPTCQQQWRREDHLSLVAFMRRDHARALREAGIPTLHALGTRPADELPAAIGMTSRVRLAQQARLQLAERETGTPRYELLDPQPGRGLARLPAPSPGDVFFDIEGDPFVGDDGLEYLLGTLDAGGFRPFWATEPAAEQQAFEDLVDALITAWDRDLGMHVYHYAPYEPTRLKALAARYDTRGPEVDRLLRGERLVDLYTVVRQGLRVSTESYSIKKLERFYWNDEERSGGVSDALGSVVAFERWLLDRDDALLEDIERYNANDCESTRALRDWLEQRRAEGGGDAVHPRPELRDGQASAGAVQAGDEVERLRRALLDGVPDGDRDADQQGRSLLAALLDWHRRESLPEWWDYFHRLALTDEELVDDAAAVGQLGDPELDGEVDRSNLWRLTFPPQDTKLGPGEGGYVDPATQKAVPVVAVDPEEGWLIAKRGKGKPPPTCRSLVPGKPLPDLEQRARLRDLAEWVLAHGIDSPLPDHRAGRDLLRRALPRVGLHGGGPLRQDGESAGEAVLRLASRLSHGVLPVQGPPGTGKTYTGARMIVRLLAQGKRVGICAVSHKVIGNLLDEVARVAQERGQALRALQKATEQQRCTAAAVDHTDANDEVEARLDDGTVDLVAGTTWLFARAGMRQRLDVLVVDEAGPAVAGERRRDRGQRGQPRPARRPAAAHPAGQGHPPARRRGVSAAAPPGRCRHRPAGSRGAAGPDLADAPRRGRTGRAARLRRPLARSARSRTAACDLRRAARRDGPAVRAGRAHRQRCSSDRGGR